MNEDPQDRPTQRPRQPGLGILDRGADYGLAVKKNQDRLYEDVRNLFEGVPHDYATTLNKGHGRIEPRECWAISDLESLEYLRTRQEWPQLRPVVKVTGRRETPEEATVQPRYYISSLDASAQRLLERYADTGASRMACTGAWT